MENRTVWVVNYKSNGYPSKAEYFCLTARQAQAMFTKENPCCEIVSVLDWREDLRNERGAAK